MGKPKLKGRGKRYEIMGTIKKKRINIMLFTGYRH